MIRELERLVYRLREANLTTKRFLKLGSDKAPLPESYEWELDPWDTDDLEGWSYWGVAGREELVLVDCDAPETVTVVESSLPQTFEVITARRKLSHFYFKVVGGEVQNTPLRIGGNPAGEVRSQNHYVVAPGVEIDYTEKKTGNRIKGKYSIAKDLPIATIEYSEFMAKMEPLTGGASGRKLTLKHIQLGAVPGERHDIGMRYATLLIKAIKLDPTTAFFELRRWNHSCNKTPMPEQDLARMVQSASNYRDNQKQPEKVDMMFKRIGKLRSGGGGLDAR